MSMVRQYTIASVVSIYVHMHRIYLVCEVLKLNNLS